MPPPKKHKKARACRICLCAIRENRVVFDVNSEWSRLLDYCLSICVTADNGPHMLCKKCSLKLKDYSEFKTLAIKNSSFWNNILLTKVKSDAVDVVESVEIKDENGSDQYIGIGDTDYNVWDEPLEASFDVPIDIGYIKEQCDTKEENKEKELIKTETAVKNESQKIIIKKEPKNLKKVMKYTNFDKVEMTENDFIKKFYKIVKLSKGTWKTQYQCRLCAYTYMRKDYLPAHTQKCFNTEVQITKPVVCEKAIPSIFYCGLCDFTSTEENIISHVNEHCEKNEMNCKLCDYVGRDAADIVSHRYKHMPEEYTYKIMCPACKKQPKNLLTLQFHYRSVHLKKTGGWCSVCNKTFQGYKYFRNHERLHKSEKCFICDFCGIRFLFRNLIVRHLEEHMDVRNYVCDTCGKSFKRNNALTYHIRAFHVKNDPVPCDHCGKKFKNQNSVRLHMKLVSKGNNFICDVCSKGHPTLNLLQKHMFWHTGEKPFGCDTCGARYKSKQILELHKKKHAGYLPYKCDLCEKQFLSTYQLKVHMSVHTGIRRVKCLVCDKTFNEKKRMLEHCKSKHDSNLIKNESQCVPLAI